MILVNDKLVFQLIFINHIRCLFESPISRLLLGGIVTSEFNRLFWCFKLVINGELFLARLSFWDFLAFLVSHSVCTLWPAVLFAPKVIGDVNISDSTRLTTLRLFGHTDLWRIRWLLDASVLWHELHQLPCTLAIDVLTVTVPTNIYFKLAVQSLQHATLFASALGFKLILEFSSEVGLIFLCSLFVQLHEIFSWAFEIVHIWHRIYHVLVVEFEKKTLSVCQ